MSIKEDFLARGHNELLSEFVTRLNNMGDATVHEIDVGKYVDFKGGSEGVRVDISHLKITSTGNMMTHAPKNVDIQAECACIKGNIGPVDKIELAFDYEFAQSLDTEPLKGRANVTMYGFEAEYTVTPSVVNIDDSYSYHEQGMLYLKLNDFKPKADNFPITVDAEDDSMNTQVVTAFLGLLKTVFKSDESL